MKISRLIVKNYRNIRNIDIHLGSIVTIIGGNNSGKSNLLRAITLPFFADDIGYLGKTLTWSDINIEAKNEYYDFLLRNKNLIREGSLDHASFQSVLPEISVEVFLSPKDTELYFVKDISCGIDKNNEIIYGIIYKYRSNNTKQVFEHVRGILQSEDITIDSIEGMKMNLLPTELYSYSIEVPGKGKISYDTLRFFRYTALQAERDDFSNSSEKLGSKSLVKLLQMKMNNLDKLIVEKEYSNFFETLKNRIGMDKIINWQNSTEIANAEEFFSEISILPNMPPMNSILNSVRLGYSGENLSSQGLGNRNLILLLVLMNSLLEKEVDYALNVLTIEEPEAHLCINNSRILISFIKAFTTKNDYIQLIYSSHNTEFINKLDLKNVVIISDGNAFALETEINSEGKDYLSKNPNLDLFKLFFSRKCILVEGLTEELLIRAYLDSKNYLNDIEVISFHKGFANIIDIWLKINRNSKNKLGIVRDFDNQPIAKTKYEKYNELPNICVRTTSEYNLEPEIVHTGNNLEILKNKYGELFGWNNLDPNELSDNWIKSKSSIMLQICKDIQFGELPDFAMPRHIQDIIDFLNKG